MANEHLGQALLMCLQASTFSGPFGGAYVAYNAVGVRAGKQHAAFLENLAYGRNDNATGVVLGLMQLGCPFGWRGACPWQIRVGILRVDASTGEHHSVGCERHALLAANHEQLDAIGRGYPFIEGCASLEFRRICRIDWPHKHHGRCLQWRDGHKALVAFCQPFVDGGNLPRLHLCGKPLARFPYLLAWFLCHDPAFRRPAYVKLIVPIVTTSRTMRLAKPQCGNIRKRS